MERPDQKAIAVLSAAMEMDPRLTIVEALGIAMRSEEDAARFYERLSEMIENGAVRARFKALAGEEAGHRRMLAAQYRRITEGMDEPRAIPGEPETAEKGRGGLAPASIEDLLVLAGDGERAAGSFYQRAADSSTDLGAKRLLQYLAEVERGHEMLLAAELLAFRRDGDAYLKNPPDFEHIGP